MRENIAQKSLNCLTLAYAQRVQTNSQKHYKALHKEWPSVIISDSGEDSPEFHPR